MSVLAITQARIGSSRLPGKVLKQINGESLLKIHLKRILKSCTITKLKVATTYETGIEQIVGIANDLGVQCHQGSINNVLSRFHETAEPENPEWVVRLTSDCPLIDSQVIDDIVNFAKRRNLDYASNTLNPTFPDGIDVEVFKYSALKISNENATQKEDLEHVTPYIWKNSSYKGGKLFSSDCFKNEQDYSDVRLTVDTPQDLIVIEKLIELLGTDKTWTDYANAWLNHTEIREINANIMRNEGYNN